MTPQQLKAMKLALEALEHIANAIYVNSEQEATALKHAICAITAIKEALTEHAMQEVQRLGQEIEQGKRGSIALARELCVQIAGYTDDDQDQCGHDYGSVDIAEILSAEVVRLQKALAQPKQQTDKFCDANCVWTDHHPDCDLAQPEQEPVAWMWRCKPYCDWPNWGVSLKRPADSGCYGDKRTEGYEDVPLYTAPPQRTEEKMVMWPCLIDTADFSKGTVTIVMQCEDYKVSAGTHWLSTTPPKENT